MTIDNEQLTIMVSLWDKILNFLKHISGGNTTIVNCKLSIVNFFNGIPPEITVGLPHRIQRLVQILQNIVDVFRADGQADGVLVDAHVV